MAVACVPRHRRDKIEGGLASTILVGQNSHHRIKNHFSRCFTGYWDPEPS